MKTLFPRAIFAAMVAAMAMSAGGCAVVAWIAAQVAPPEKTPPLYDPPHNKRVLVFVDDIFVPAPATVKADLAAQVGQRLVANKLARSVVPYDKLQGALEGPRIVSIGEAGKRLGADMVLYVNIERFSLKDEPASPVWHPIMRCSVRWVDVTGQLGKRLWPTDHADGQLVDPPVELPVTEDNSPTAETDRTRELLAREAQRIVDMFLEHEAARGGS